MTGLKDIIIAVGKLVNLSFPVLVGAALLVFVSGLAKFILNVGSEGKEEEGKNMMVWGVAGLFVMVSVWGLVGFMQRAFNITPTATQNKPEAGVRPEPGLLPSRNPWYLWPANQPEPGNLPTRDLNLPGAYEPFK